MIGIDTIVSIKSSDEYGGKYAGKLGIVKKFTDDRVGVEFAGLKNPASKYGLSGLRKRMLRHRSLTRRNATTQSFRQLLPRLSSTSLLERLVPRSV